MIQQIVIVPHFLTCAKMYNIHFLRTTIFVNRHNKLLRTIPGGKIQHQLSVCREPSKTESLGFQLLLSQASVLLSDVIGSLFSEFIEIFQPRSFSLFSFSHVFTFLLINITSFIFNKAEV